MDEASALRDYGHALAAAGRAEDGMLVCARAAEDLARLAAAGAPDEVVAALFTVRAEAAALAGHAGRHDVRDRLHTAITADAAFATGPLALRALGAALHAVAAARLDGLLSALRTGAETDPDGAAEAAALAVAVRHRAGGERELAESCLLRLHCLLVTGDDAGALEAARLARGLMPAAPHLVPRFELLLGPLRAAHPGEGW
ncbi:hypothetical protein Afil01_64460 [Actinorhabdospora filicis]|uniref:Uncharacterized protein n=1 Tax=Actinorhabdospora filicis TaxID=1785913 RepID=A0A9W6STF0_9ACTN|nr:hypothetical protein [Actinorhabdospora filicis]GLZ81639.1 hypothetical protein Afil01_64460 [Actinorhabdospora filicis]